MSIIGLYELYNSNSGEELCQATIEEEDANTALLKHPNIFRITYSNKNTDYDRVIEEMLDNLPCEKSNHNFLWRLFNNKFVLYTKTNAKPAFVKTWKMAVAIFIFLSGCYLSSGNHFDNLIKWLKTFF